MTFEGNTSLFIGDVKPVYGISEAGAGQAREDKMSPLSAVIRLINERFGTEWTGS